MAHSDEQPEHIERADRKEEQVDRLAALYGLTPKVETAIIDAVQAGNARRIRTLVAPLHPADQADLLEWMPVRTAGALVRFLGDHLDANVLHLHRTFHGSDFCDLCVGAAYLDGMPS